MASGQALLAAMLLLIVCDVIGGLIGVASGAETWGGAWGFNTESTVPLPIAAAQLVLAWLAARNVRPPVGRLAAVVLSGVCLISVLAGLFDGDLIENVATDGLFSWGVAWGGVLLVVTAAVGLLAAARARQLHRRRRWRPVLHGRSEDGDRSTTTTATRALKPAAHRHVCSRPAIVR